MAPGGGERGVASDDMATTYLTMGIRCRRHPNNTDVTHLPMSELHALFAFD